MNIYESGDIKLFDISLAKLEGGIIKITLRNSSVVIIKLKNMNFNAKDQEAAFAEIAKFKIIDESSKNYLEEFVDLLIEENKKVNLIGKSTTEDVFAYVILQLLNQAFYLIALFLNRLTYLISINPE